VSSGAVYFARPRLVRHTEEPVASTFLVDTSHIAFSSAGERRTLDLAASPTLRALVDGIRLVLAGDVDALRESFRVDFEAPIEGGAPGSWRIHLEPLHAPVRDLIASIEIAGRDQTPRELRVVERGGDETRTRFSEVRTDRRFGDEELATIFQVPVP
jgi:hypothetical protein